MAILTYFILPLLVGIVAGVMTQRALSSRTNNGWDNARTIPFDGTRRFLRKTFKRGRE